MEPRAAFDGLLIAVLGLAIWLDHAGLSLSTDLLESVGETVVNIDLVVYLIIAGVLGVGFVGYIAIYLPRKQSENVPR